MEACFAELAAVAAAASDSTKLPSDAGGQPISDSRTVEPPPPLSGSQDSVNQLLSTRAPPCCPSLPWRAQLLSTPPFIVPTIPRARGSSVGGSNQGIRVEYLGGTGRKRFAARSAPPWLSPADCSVTGHSPLGEEYCKHQAAMG